MTDIEILKEGIKALDSKKADDIRILKVRDLTILANYFVIVSGSSSTQVKALADEVDFKLGEKGEEPKSIDGKASGNWIVLDYIDVVFHVSFFLGDDLLPVPLVHIDGVDVVYVLVAADGNHVGI